MTTVDDWKHALMALFPPGAFSTDPRSLHGVFCEADARLIHTAALSVEALEPEVFPGSSVSCLDDWERLYRAPRSPGASAAQRQAALEARWRGGMPFNLKGVRSLIADLVNPEYAFRDDFKNGIIDWRYERLLHACTLVESVGPPPYQRIAVGTGVDARWDADHKLGGVSLLPLVVEDGKVTTGDFWYAAHVSSSSVADGAVGVCLYEDESNSQWWGLWGIGADIKIRSGYICDDKVSTPSLDQMEPTPPYWLIIGREDGITKVYLEVALPSPWDPSGITPIGTLDVPFHPRSAGPFVWNDGSFSSQQMTFNQIRMVYAKKQHNVEIIENCLATLLGPDDDHRWFCFIRRSPDDEGTADYKRAQLELDRFKPGHINLTIGETNWFLTDDSHSLTDRDVLGQ